MADPLSVAASVVGLITAAAQITKVITGIIKQTKNAPQRLEETRIEVNDIKRVLEQLQLYLMKYSRVSRSRSSLILVEHVVITLASCVSTFSELDSFVLVLESSQELRLIDKFKWGRKIEPLNDILHRLQMHKQSLSLMLIILTGDSQLEAETKVDELVTVCQASLARFDFIASRMQDFMAGNIPTVSTSQIPMLGVGQAADLPSNTSVTRTSVGFAFEEILLNSRAYRQASSDIDGAFSIASSAGRTGSWTMLSGLSLSDMSHIGILAIPMYPADIDNPEHYQFDMTTYNPSFLDEQSHDLSIQREPQPIFGQPISESIRLANVAISVTNDSGERFIYGYIPLVVAKCGVFLKESELEEKDIFAISGHPLRIEEAIKIFNTPGLYGKKFDWNGYTLHDASGVLLRYLKTLDQPIVPYDHYDHFTQPLRPHIRSLEDIDEIGYGSDLDQQIVQSLQSAVTSLPALNRQLLLYIIDLLAVTCSRSDRNNMTSIRTAGIFNPSVLSLSPNTLTSEDSILALCTVAFLIDHQEYFLIGFAR